MKQNTVSCDFLAKTIKLLMRKFLKEFKDVIIHLLSLYVILMIGLKIVGVLDWAWYVVLFPLYIVPLVCLVVVSFFLLSYCFEGLWDYLGSFSNKRKRRGSGNGFQDKLMKALEKQKEEAASKSKKNVNQSKNDKARG